MRSKQRIKVFRHPLPIGVVSVVAFLTGARCNSEAKPEVLSDAAAFSQLAVWDDGLAEVCYYDATETIYGKDRPHTRVMLVNREWLNAAQMVKAESPHPGDPRTIPVFKTNIIEEIPTENYDYRYIVTVFVGRPGLRFEKLSASSQEWCGTTFKQALRSGDAIRVRGFSYFEGEADKEWTFAADSTAYPREALFLLAREVASSGIERSIQVLPRLRSTHLVEPGLQPVRLSRETARRRISVPAGSFDAYRVLLTSQDDSIVARFDVEVTAPFRLLAYENSEGTRLELRFSERRAYWDRDRPSRFYRQGHAP